MDTRTTKLDRTLAAGVSAVGVFNLASTLALPARAHIPKPSFAVLMLWTALLAAHAAAYWFAARLRVRLGLGRYLGAQALIVFALGVSGALFPIGAALYLVLTAYAVVVTNRLWGRGTIGVTLASIALFTVNAAIVQDLYRASTWGLGLAIISVVAHAIAAMIERPTSVASRPSSNLDGAS